MQVPFYRTRLTAWLAAYEETYRFILLEADPAESRDWASLCIEQVHEHSASFVLHAAYSACANTTGDNTVQLLSQNCMPPVAEVACVTPIIHETH